MKGIVLCAKVVESARNFVGKEVIASTSEYFRQLRGDWTKGIFYAATWWLVQGNMLRSYVAAAPGESLTLLRGGCPQGYFYFVIRLPRYGLTFNRYPLSVATVSHQLSM